MLNQENQIKASVDSFKVRIPLIKVNVKETALFEKVVKAEVTSQGEWEFEKDELGNDLFKAKSLCKNDHGVKYRALIQTLTFKHGKDKHQKPQDFLIILINSKCLGPKYLEGITPENYSLVYDALMRLEWFDFTYLTFIESDITDTDIKIDLNTDILHDALMREWLNTNTGHVSSEVGKGKKSHNTKTNKGIEYNTRYSGTPVNPFLKIYDKPLELRNKSNTFYEYWLDEKCPEKLTRIEGTLKDKAHFKHHGITNTLSGLIDADLNEVIRSMLKSQINRKEYKIKEEKMNSTDRLIAEIIHLQKESGIDSIQIIFQNTWDRWFSGAEYSNKKTEKYRLKRKFIEVYEEHFINGNYTPSPEELRHQIFFDFLDND